MSDENITVGSAHIDLGSAFRGDVQQRVLEVGKKYLGDLTMASVHFAREGEDFRCSVNMQMGSHPVMTGAAVADDIRASFQTALGKVEKQLRRTKRLEREDRPHQPDKIVSA